MVSSVGPVDLAQAPCFVGVSLWGSPAMSTDLGSHVSHTHVNMKPKLEGSPFMLGLICQHHKPHLVLDRDALT